MASRRSRTNSPRTEFPILEVYGLYASTIKGDGNCLFNALSDQLHGHQAEHKALRDATIAHMRANSDFYRQYMAVNSSRRNPRRQAAMLSTSIDTSYHSEEELQRQFDAHLEKMGQPGEWADNMEVSAFASALNVHVNVWQADYVYKLSPRVYYDPSDAGEDERAVLNIAYHGWEHYSSVRNLAGPREGLPEVIVKAPTSSKKRSSVERDDDEQPISRASKRRSPLPLFDSDSTPEGSESSSDESNPSSISSQSQPVETSEPQPHRKLTLKLRCTKLSTTTESAPRAVLRLPWDPNGPEIRIKPTTPPHESQITINLTTDDTTETANTITT